mmetsp:Transcript_13936/g.20377  ORF Transcript_13936/g.20377 Transcript_13936/m.20377 type:complete len:123 (-) Transcript_13936:66-434(-)
MMSTLIRYISATTIWVVSFLPSYPNCVILFFYLLEIINPTWVEQMRKEAEVYSDEVNATNNVDSNEVVSDNVVSETNGGLVSAGHIETPASEESCKYTYDDIVLFDKITQPQCNDCDISKHS